jgi:hypothetical protein
MRRRRRDRHVYNRPPGPHESSRMPWDFMEKNYIHIPRTGGTSVEHLVPANHTVRWHARGCCEHGFVEKCCNHGSPWHLPLDVLAAILPEVRQSYGSTPTWCVVRHPDDRWKSSQAFIAHSRKRWPDSAAFPKSRPPRTPIQLRALFANSRFAAEWDEELVHLQPQSWMVWDAHGQPQCSCAVAFENLGGLLASHTRSHNVMAAGGYEHVGPSVTSAACNGNCTDSTIAHQNLYFLDLSLWKAATSAGDRGCYRPQPQNLTSSVLSRPRNRVM